MEERREWQKHIFGKAKTAGITNNADLHALVSAACGKDSLKEITKNDYFLIIKELDKRSSELYKPSKSKPQTKSVEGMSDGQCRMVWHLMYELRKFDREPAVATIGERLCGIIKRELKVDASPKKPFVWLTYKDGSTLIERLKKYIYNAEKRYLRGG